jgi:hypothetical protein
MRFYQDNCVMEVFPWNGFSFRDEIKFVRVEGLDQFFDLQFFVLMPF